ncbi:uncharacterized protein LOC108670644 isoform X2 [Hyalella azteca]|uniref:Uncharacterized protein LOC108670644 isoform X2 n=1 Tax=Hyalella azteca TaxID=294128 RepID=A0A979FPI0_HYAAZ|nr:uncharacterized protein LOC108670644 isoform X2 [Hyalella azteca]
MPDLDITHELGDYDRVSDMSFSNSTSVSNPEAKKWMTRFIDATESPHGYARETTSLHYPNTTEEHNITSLKNVSSDDHEMILLQNSPSKSAPNIKRKCSPTMSENMRKVPKSDPQNQNCSGHLKYSPKIANKTSISGNCSISKSITGELDDKGRLEMASKPGDNTPSSICETFPPNKRTQIVEKYTNSGGESIATRTLSGAMSRSKIDSSEVIGQLEFQDTKMADCINSQESANACATGVAETLDFSSSESSCCSTSIKSSDIQSQKKVDLAEPLVTNFSNIDADLRKFNVICPPADKVICCAEVTEAANQSDSSTVDAYDAEKQEFLNILGSCCVPESEASEMNRSEANVFRAKKFKLGDSSDSSTCDAFEASDSSSENENICSRNLPEISENIRTRNIELESEDENASPSKKSFKSDHETDTVPIKRTNLKMPVPMLTPIPGSGQTLIDWTAYQPAVTDTSVADPTSMRTTSDVGKHSEISVGQCQELLSATQTCTVRDCENIIDGSKKRPEGEERLLDCEKATDRKYVEKTKTEVRNITPEMPMINPIENEKPLDGDLSSAEVSSTTTDDLNADENSEFLYDSESELDDDDYDYDDFTSESSSEDGEETPEEDIVMLGLEVSSNIGYLVPGKAVARKIRNVIEGKEDTDLYGFGLNEYAFAYDTRFCNVNLGRKVTALERKVLQLFALKSIDMKEVLLPQLLAVLKENPDLPIEGMQRKSTRLKQLTKNLPEWKSDFLKKDIKEMLVYLIGLSMSLLPSVQSPISLSSHCNSPARSTNDEHIQEFDSIQEKVMSLKDEKLANSEITPQVDPLTKNSLSSKQESIATLMEAMEVTKSVPCEDLGPEKMTAVKEPQQPEVSTNLNDPSDKTTTPKRKLFSELPFPENAKKQKLLISDNVEDISTLDGIDDEIQSVKIKVLGELFTYGSELSETVSSTVTTHDSGKNSAHSKSSNLVLSEETEAMAAIDDSKQSSKDSDKEAAETKILPQIASCLDKVTEASTISDKPINKTDTIETSCDSEQLAPNNSNVNKIGEEDSNRTKQLVTPAKISNGVLCPLVAVEFSKGRQENPHQKLKSTQEEINDTQRQVESGANIKSPEKEINTISKSLNTALNQSSSNKIANAMDIMENMPNEPSIAPEVRRKLFDGEEKLDEDVANKAEETVNEISQSPLTRSNVETRRSDPAVVSDVSQPKELLPSAISSASDASEVIELNRNEGQSFMEAVKMLSKYCKAGATINNVSKGQEGPLEGVLYDLNDYDGWPKSIRNNIYPPGFPSYYLRRKVKEKYTKPIKWKWLYTKIKCNAYIRNLNHTPIMHILSTGQAHLMYGPRKKVTTKKPRLCTKTTNNMRSHDKALTNYCSNQINGFPTTHKPTASFKSNSPLENELRACQIPPLESMLPNNFLETSSENLPVTDICIPKKIPFHDHASLYESTDGISSLHDVPLRNQLASNFNVPLRTTSKCFPLHNMLLSSHPTSKKMIRSYEELAVPGPSSTPPAPTEILGVSEPLFRHAVIVALQELNFNGISMVDESGRKLRSSPWIKTEVLGEGAGSCSSNKSSNFFEELICDHLLFPGENVLLEGRYCHDLAVHRLQRKDSTLKKLAKCTYARRNLNSPTFVRNQFYEERGCLLIIKAWAKEDDKPELVEAIVTYSARVKKGTRTFTLNDEEENSIALLRGLLCGPDGPRSPRPAGPPGGGGRGQRHRRPVHRTALPEPLGHRPGQPGQVNDRIVALQSSGATLPSLGRSSGCGRSADAGRASGPLPRTHCHVYARTTQGNTSNFSWGSLYIRRNLQKTHSGSNGNYF